MRKFLLLTLAALVVAAGALAAPYDVGDVLPDVTAWDPAGAADQVVTTATVLRLTHAARLAEAVTDNSATIYLYEIDADRTVLRVYGPLEVRDWTPPKNLLALIRGTINVVHVESITGNCIVTVGD